MSKKPFNPIIDSRNRNYPVKKVTKSEALKSVKKAIKIGKNCLMFNENK